MGSDSGPKNEQPPIPEGIVEVGEGRTSLNREVASLRSVFQMPVPQENADELYERPTPTDGAEIGPHGEPLTSAKGGLGCVAVGDIELLANDSLRGRVSG